MTEVDRALVRRKLARVLRNLEDLAPVEGLSLEYDELDDRIVLEAVGEARRLFPRYVRAVEELLDQG